MSWKTTHNRPEDIYENADKFYEEKEATRYALSNTMRKTQRELTMRALEFQVPPLSAKVLDAGCGCGFSLEVLKEIGYTNIKGFDLTPRFVEVAKQKGYAVRIGDLRKIPYSERFDVIISISALQWITASNLEKNVKKTAKEFNRLLNPEGCALIHFYPKTEVELMHTARVFNENGFAVKVVTDNPNNAKKRKNFLVLNLKN